VAAGRAAGPNRNASGNRCRRPVQPAGAGIQKRRADSAANRPARVDIESLKLVAGPISLQAEGRLALQGPQQFQLSLKGLALERLNTLWQDEPTLKGQLAAEAKLSGTAAAPVIDANVTVKDAGGYDVSLSNIDLRMGFEMKPFA
jgi:autotransporter translocation and assembly factor TamB